jgi:hypothetical protein
MSVNDI